MDESTGALTTLPLANGGLNRAAGNRTNVALELFTEGALKFERTDPELVGPEAEKFPCAM